MITFNMFLNNLEDMKRVSSKISVNPNTFTFIYQNRHAISSYVCKHPEYYKNLLLNKNLIKMIKF